MMVLLNLLLLWCALQASFALMPVRPLIRCRPSLQLYLEKNASGKGFGKKSEPSKVEDMENEQWEGKVSSGTGSAETIKLPEKDLSSLSDEEKILQTDMYKRKQQRKEEALQEKIAKLREEEELIASDPSVGAVPELVADRMIRRIAVFFGVPVFGGLTIFVGAFFYSKKYDMVVPPAIIAYATQVPFVVGLLGITYGILSASWDNEPGSALGIKEFKTNFKRIQDGLTRTRDTVEMRSEIEKESEELRNNRRR
mmetsp:Transcript_10017/g.16752  ORF Transcript_10017/g.16752 Transcript_10017/m.16752 type:complete len:254 (+) Transcript_10017:81-842(+)